MIRGLVSGFVMLMVGALMTWVLATGLQDYALDRKADAGLGGQAPSIAAQHGASGQWMF